MLAALAAAGATFPRTASAQCDGRPIRRISVVTEGLFTERDTRIPHFLQTLGSYLHTTSRTSTVESDLLFRPGDACDGERLAETQRLLRAESYLRTAQVTPYEATGEFVDLEVRTQDEWSLRGSARIQGGGPRGPVRRLRIAEDNVAGRGLFAQLRFNNEGRQPGFDAELSTRRFLGHHTGDIQLGNSGVGTIGEQSVLRPFASEFDRTAWREATRYRKEPFLFENPALGTVIQPLVTAGADIGLAHRFGRPRRLALVGTVLSFERLFPEDQAFATVSANDSAAAALMAGRWLERRRLRAHLLIGARTIHYVQRWGVDAVNATEDIRLGFEGGFIGGMSLLGGHGLEHDQFTAGEFFLGAAPGERNLVFLRTKWEGRLLHGPGGGREWNGVIASGDIVLYRLQSMRSSLVFGASAAGGWHNTTPFQLALDGPAGVRGYGMALPVAQRVVLRLEQRTFRGVLFGVIDVGTAWFADVGRGWAGDAPFAQNTDVLGSVGGGLRLAFPSGSRLTYRLDVAVPMNGRGVEIRTGFGQQIGATYGEAPDVARSREQVSSTTVFNFPRF